MIIIWILFNLLYVIWTKCFLFDDDDDDNEDEMKKFGFN